MFYCLQVLLSLKIELVFYCLQVLLSLKIELVFYCLQVLLFLSQLALHSTVPYPALTQVSAGIVVTNWENRALCVQFSEIEILIIMKPGNIELRSTKETKFSRKGVSQKILIHFTLSHQV